VDVCIGACSWSLRAGTPQDLAERLSKAGLSAVQLAIDPIRKSVWSVDAIAEALDEAGIRIRSGMMAMKGEDYSSLESIRKTGGVRSDEHWERNLEAAEDNAEIAAGLDIRLVTFHAGFLPHDRKDPLRAVMIERVLEIAERFVEHGVKVGLETGQETAETLVDVLEELGHPDIGVNFDPANLVLYGMGDPVAALKRLSSYVMQIHVKDARPSTAPGSFGEEVPVGKGAVDWAGFFKVYRDERMGCDLMIERESGEQRVQDIRAARELVERYFS
jgi:sugar phosphate isomerase/epimerase